MAAESTKVAVLVAVAGLGVALVALPWIPTARPNPLPAEFEPGSGPGRELLTALQWHDEACATGDLDGFRAHVTEAYARTFARRLQQLGRALDAAALRDYVGADRRRGLAALAQRGGRGFARGARACLVQAAPAGQRGAQGLAFAWDGQHFRLDAVVHDPDAEPADARAVAGFARRLLDAP